MPETEGNIFNGVTLGDATLYVPKSSVNAYKTEFPWERFGAILPINPTGVEDLKANNTSKAKADKNAPIFDLMGRRLQQKPASGYYIQGGKKYLVK